MMLEVLARTAATAVMPSVVALCCVAGSPAAADLAETIAEFVPHRANYELTLHRGGGASKVSSASGRMEFEWGDVCNGWTVKQRSRVVLTYSGGPQVDFGWSVNAWESKDGLRYRFFITRYSEGAMTEEVRGEAWLRSIGEAGLATFESPVSREVELPSGTIFPTWHSFEILHAARNETLPLWRIVFDGSGEEDGLTGISGVLAKTFPPQREGLIDERLQGGMLSWQVLLAYFSPQEAASEPMHEQELRLYPNGVAEGFVFDYGDFALGATLVTLEALPDPGC